MKDSFKFEIVSPEKIIFSNNATMVTLPSYEGDMSVLKDHISVITFLRPGKIKVEKNDQSIDEFFVEDGIVEYFKDGLVALSVSAINVKDLSKEFLDKLSKDTQDKLMQKDISDDERYILNHKLDTLKEIRV
mgnify:CR=1 FL=1|tara:strand:+ start:219 stop:614 length:396 start_codon:yes stop_codon:yes gene_type:complete